MSISSFSKELFSLSSMDLPSQIHFLLEIHKSISNWISQAKIKFVHWKLKFFKDCCFFHCFFMILEKEIRNFACTFVTCAIHSYPSWIMSVTSFSSHTSEAWGLKIGMHNPYMNASKVTNQIFDILPKC